MSDQRTEIIVTYRPLCHTCGYFLTRAGFGIHKPHTYTSVEDAMTAVDRHVRGDRCNPSGRINRSAELKEMIP